MKSLILVVFLASLTLDTMSQECDNITVNLTATAASTAVTFDGSIQVELTGSGVVESYTWSNGRRNMPAFMNLEQLPQLSLGSVSRIYPVELNSAPGDELVVIGSNNDFQVLRRDDSGWILSEPASLGQNGCNNLNIRGVSAGDLTGDGLIDLVFTLGDNCSDALEVFRLMQCITPCEQYTQVNQIQSIISPNSATNSGNQVKLIDFDLDGDLDIINSHSTNNTGGLASKVWLNDGFGQFTVSVGHELCEADDIEVFDYDLDGDLDVLAFGVPSNTCSLYGGDGIGACVYENTGAGFERTIVWISGSEPGNRLHGLVDFNSDGFVDVLCSGGVSVLFGDGAGNFQSGFSSLDWPTNYDGTPVAVDLDYNETPDVLVSYDPQIGFGFYGLMNVDGDGAFSEHPSIGIPVGLSTQINLETLPYSELELSSSREHFYQGDLMERGLLMKSTTGPFIYLLSQLDLLSQSGLPPGDYELCINTTDGCSYCNSVTVQAESGNNCTDLEACNYNPNAIEDDGSCVYGNFPYDCNGNCLNDADENGICDEFEQSAPFNLDYNGDGIIDVLDMLQAISLFGQPVETVPCISPE